MEKQRSPSRDQTEALRLTAFLPYRLSVLSNTISETIADTYRREHDLSVPQWRVMAVVHGAPGLSAKGVSIRTAMDKVAVSRAVSKLIDQGRLERGGSPTDGRLSALYLTTDGEAVYAAVAPQAQAFEEKLMAEFSEEERALLSLLLGKLAGAVSPEKPLW